jgi:hypothetical protein
MAGTTGLEPAASAVTGQRSNQLNYVPTCRFDGRREHILDPMNILTASFGTRKRRRTFALKVAVLSSCVTRAPLGSRPV